MAEQSAISTPGCQTLTPLTPRPRPRLTRVSRHWMPVRSAQLSTRGCAVKSLQCQGEWSRKNRVWGSWRIRCSLRGERGTTSGQGGSPATQHPKIRGVQPAAPRLTPSRRSRGRRLCSGCRQPAPRGGVGCGAGGRHHHGDGGGLWWQHSPPGAQFPRHPPDGEAGGRHVGADDLQRAGGSARPARHPPNSAVVVGADAHKIWTHTHTQGGWLRGQGPQGVTPGCRSRGSLTFSIHPCGTHLPDAPVELKLRRRPSGTGLLLQHHVLEIWGGGS